MTEDRAQPAADTDVARPGSRHVVTALAVGGASLVAFTVLRLIVALGGLEPLAIDVWWQDTVTDTGNELLVAIAWVPAVAGGTIGMAVISALIVALFVWRRRRWDAATFAISIAAVVLIGAPMAAVIARVRPETSLAESVATSFPSGHTAVAVTMSVSLGLLLHRWWVWALGAMWSILMMWSRTQLHAHWLSDVIAGALEGIAVATIVWSLMEIARTRRATRKHPEMPTAVA